MQLYQEQSFKVPARLWLPIEDIPANALEQIRAAAEHPRIAQGLAVMPDCHVGFGVTIGTVLPLSGAISPNAVGVDIGCGMAALNTGVTIDPERMTRAFWIAWKALVEGMVPTGFHWHAKPIASHRILDKPLKAEGLQSYVRERAALQLGTLGGGNHFLEAQVDEAGTIWLMVHSGSRGIGKKIADEYHALAVQFSKGKAPRDIEYLDIETPAGRSYIHDMEWANEYAAASRALMMDRMLTAFREVAGDIGETGKLIDTPHNFARYENHGGEDLVIHRKGATSAMFAEPGIIPGSMGSPSFIVAGKGNEESFLSCSHGAGRRLGRAQAKREYAGEEGMETFARTLEDTFNVAEPGHLDESPMVYKEISEVIGRQSDLISVRVALAPIITIKGGGRDD